MGIYERPDQDWYGPVHVGLLHHEDWLKPVATHIYILISSNGGIYSFVSDSILFSDVRWAGSSGMAYQWLAATLVWPLKFLCAMRIEPAHHMSSAQAAGHIGQAGACGGGWNVSGKSGACRKGS